MSGHDAQITGAGRAARRWLCAALALAVLSACGARDKAVATSLRVEISHVVADATLVLDSQEYRSPSGDSFTISALRYYLSNVRLHRADGSWYTVPRDPKSSAGYFLIDAREAASREFEITAPAGTYDGIEFLIGIDDERNHAGAQTGTLDPAHGLFWTWKSGYIFFLLEGQSPQSPVDDHALKFHVGGGAPSLARTIYLPFGADAAQVDARIAPVVHLHADLAALLGGEAPLRFAERHAVMGGPEATALADRLPSVFRVDHVHN